MPPIKLAVADDQKLFLNGLKYIINSFEGIDLIIEANNGLELIEKIKEERPDVILLDLKMPVMDGVEATKQIKMHYGEIKIILLSMYNDERLINHMMEIGANGYLLKDEEPDVLEEAIRAVMEKDFYFNEYVSKALLKGVKGKKKVPVSKFSLNAETNISPRELEVLELICQELTTTEIAQKLFISVRTVEGHRKKMMEKTNVRNMAGLVIYAMKSGLVKL